MSFLVIGDIHLKTNNLIEIEQVFQEIIKVAKERNDYENIVFLGDIFDKHEIIHSEVLTCATKFFYDLSNIKPIYILIGNHDRPNNSTFLTDKHHLNALKYWKNTYIIDDILVKDKYIFVPYVPPGRFLEALQTKDINLNDVTCIFAHQEFKGSELSPGIKSENGDVWNENIYIVSGHIHEYNRLNEYILYIGTPIQQTYAEKKDKTISIIKFEDLKLNEERIYLNIPRKVEFNLTCKELLNMKFEENLKCRIILSGSQSELKSISDIVRDLKKNNKNLIFKYNIVSDHQNISNGILSRSLAGSLSRYQKYSFIERLKKNIETNEYLIWCMNNL